MAAVVLYLIAFVLLWIIFAAATFVYVSAVGGVDFGTVGTFTIKSFILVAVVATTVFIPFGGWIALALWWIGVVIAFGMDFWEARVFVVIIWVLSFLANFALLSALR